MELHASAALIMIAGATLSLQFDQLVTAIGFGISGLVFALALFARQFAIRATSFGLSVWMLAAPFVTPLLVASPQLVESVPLSWAHRIAIWRYTCARIMEQPWIGHGIDSGRMPTDMLAIRRLTTRGIPVHPHSASLQVWHDLGLVGALLAAMLLCTAAGALEAFRAGPLRRGRNCSGARHVRPDGQRGLERLAGVVAGDAAVDRGVDRRARR
ncbi:MAG: O-antigen ligase family protein [Caulobacteraceae bacterium]|nr:O-antigen ligase family protein [Caulobacteraceae bacterium]